ncbi:MAG: glycoside hydrolase family 31 protein [Archangium sp.]|nr:glycoside hydrolase family 31 protein [Archangium sp.]
MRSCLLVFALTLCACPPPVPPPAPLELSGDGWNLAALDGGALAFTREGAPLVTLPPDAFQVGVVSRLEDTSSSDPYWLVVNDGVFTPTLPMGFAWRAATGATVSREGDALVIALTFTRTLTATVRATKAADGHVVLRFVPEGTATIGYLRLRAGVDAAEAFYGLGEWFDGANHRGKLRPLQLEADLNLESAASENHVSVPFLVGSRGWGLFVETYRHGVMDVAKTDSAIVDTMWGTAEESALGLTIHLFSAADALDVPLQYYRVTGFPRPPADWATGPWIWRNESQDQAEVEDDVRQIRALDLPTSGIWIDRPYATEVNTFDYDPAKFPDAGAMVSTIRSAGLKLALWHTPYLAELAQPMRAEADLNGYFPPQQGTWLNRWSAPLDFTRPEAVTFWRGLITRYTNDGVEGFKLDFAEDVIAGLSGRSSGWRFFNGETDRTMTDGYSRRYHDVYRSVLANNDGFLLVRHARWGEQNMGLVVWPGDIDATLTKFGERFTERGGDSVVGVGGLPSAIRAGVGLSMSGFPYFASDTGGYRHSPPDKETFMRWVEHSALMPVMQTGDSSSQPPWLYTPENGRDAEALDTYREFARLHLRLFPFFWSHVKSMAQTGRPVVRPYGLQFASLGVHPEDTYALGDELLVAPVETKGATTRTLIKPPGRWFSWWDGAELTGEAGAAVVVPAPLKALPLFIREGALVPMLRPGVDTLSPATDPGVDSFAAEAGPLWVRVQPGAAPSRFDVFDGTVLEQTGAQLKATPGTRFTTSVIWELRGVARPASVEHGGAVPEVPSLEVVTSGFTFSAGVLLIKTPLDGQSTILK